MDLSPRPISLVAEDLGLGPDDYVQYGRGKAKLDLALLPDYLAYARGEILGWGFWGNDWRSPA